MTQRNNVTSKPIHPASLRKRMWQGGGIAFIIILMFLFSAGDGDPNWPQYWMIKPLLIVPIAGALGGSLYYFTDHLRYHGGWKRVLAILISLIAYLVVLWMGMVLGLNGTYWN